jgi:hypothetical protein
LGVAFSKGGLPEYIINKITPAANISTFLPSYYLVDISGAIYPYVPNLVFNKPLPSLPFNKQENPKSAIFNTKASESSKFSGFISLCA